MEAAGRPQADRIGLVPGRHKPRLASYYMETMGLDQKVTWIGTGNVDTMLGSLKSKQVDVLVSSLSLLNESMEQGWGELLFDGTDEAVWNKYIGGKVPVTAHFTLQSTIDKDPAKMQAFVTALWRATQWVKVHTPEQIYDVIEPYVGSTSRKANILEINALQKVADYDATIDAEGFARGEKVWFREMTGIKPLTIAEVVSPAFVEAARKAYPGWMFSNDCGTLATIAREPSNRSSGAKQVVSTVRCDHRGSRRRVLQRAPRRVRGVARTIGFRQEHRVEHDRDTDQAERR